MVSALLIPIYEPNEKVLPFLKTFKEGDFDYFLVVDDGSGGSFKDRFADIEKETVFTVLSYPKNKGKGHALKTGLKKLLKEHEDIEIVVTGDGDGQHTYEDMLRVEKVGELHPNSLTMGCRDFSLPDVPSSSRFGNRFSTGFLHLSTGYLVSDTQTGLRAIPKALFPLALKCPGERYDYEMAFLTSVAKLFDVHEITIQTVYEGNNAVSHFHHVRDGSLIYRSIWIYLLASILRFALDLVLFEFGYRFFLEKLGDSLSSVAVSGVLSTTIAGGVALLIIALFVFYTPGRKGRQILHYVMHTLFLEVIGIPLLMLFCSLFPNASPTLIKGLIDFQVLMLLYGINLLAVFVKRGYIKSRSKNDEENR